MKSGIFIWSALVLTVAGGVIYQARTTNGHKTNNAITITFRGSDDLVPGSPKDPPRCIFFFRLENPFSDVALVGPSKLKVANATVMKNIPSVTVPRQGGFDLALPGRDRVPCSEYRMKPWVDPSSCILMSGNECKVLNVRGEGKSVGGDLDGASLDNRL